MRAFGWASPLVACSLALMAAPCMAAPAADEKPVIGKPNPDALEKPSARDVATTNASSPAPGAALSGSSSESGSTKGAKSLRTTATEGERPLVGEPVELDEALKLMNKLASHKGKIEGGKAEILRRDLGALLAGNSALRIDALGCDKLNPLTDGNGRIQIMECTLQYTRISKRADTRIEVNFSTTGWLAANAKIKDAVFRVLSE